MRWISPLPWEYQDARECSCFSVPRVAHSFRKTRLIGACRHFRKAAGSFA